MQGCTSIQNSSTLSGAHNSTLCWSTSSTPISGHADPNILSSPFQIAMMLAPSTELATRDDTDHEDEEDSSSGSSAGGLTPTPKENPSVTGLDWLTELIDDLEMTTSPPKQRSKSNNLCFPTPKEAAAYLKAHPRTDIDLDVQRCLLDEEKGEALEVTVRKWQRDRDLCGLSTDEEQRLVALKTLVHEAANRSLATLKKQYMLSKRATATTATVAAGSSSSTRTTNSSTAAARSNYEDARLRIYCAWKHIEADLTSDVMSGDSSWQNAQRLLSCMCIFNPALSVGPTSFESHHTSSTPTSTSAFSATSSSFHSDYAADIPLPCEYGENVEALTQRKARQLQMVRMLKIQRAQQLRHSATPNLFLWCTAPASPPNSSTAPTSSSSPSDAVSSNIGSWSCSGSSSAVKAQTLNRGAGIVAPLLPMLSGTSTTTMIRPMQSPVPLPSWRSALVDLSAATNGQR